MIDECKRNAYRLREYDKDFLPVFGRVVCVSAAEDLYRRTDNSRLFVYKTLPHTVSARNTKKYRGGNVLLSAV